MGLSLQRLTQAPGWILHQGRRVRRSLLMFFLRPLFAAHGARFHFDPDGSYSYGTISVGDHVYIGQGAYMSATDSRIFLGNHVMFGPYVSVVGGDHNTRVLGRFMGTVKEKRPEDDQPVWLEDDVWVGARAVILKGVRIGRGTIVAAGAVVTRSMPPYCVAGGVPARVIRWRWSIEQVLEHERALYAVGSRLSVEQLKACRQEHPVSTHRDAELVQ